MNVFDTEGPRGYRTHPVHLFPTLNVQGGFDALAEHLAGALNEAPQRVAIDGFVGVEWALFQSYLQEALTRRGVAVSWFSTADCFLAPETIARLLEPTLTVDPVFGRLFHGHLEELWDGERAQAQRRGIDARRGPTVVYGFGASLLCADAYRVYVEVPKDRLQERAVAGAIANVGAHAPESFNRMYKRFYFVDWPMLNRIKRALLPRLDLLIDARETAEPLFVEGGSFRATLAQLAGQPFRVKPWFAPGPWGGQWMKEQFGLPSDQPNYAWSFELIAPENGLLLGDGHRYLECAFDYLLWQEPERVLGPAVTARYGTYFPIRFDYLDTMGGTNLSCQVHPQLDYMRDEFGEPFTQDETYYIVTCAPDARVFLGLRDDADVVRFEADARAARDQKIPFAIESHVNSLPSKPHDLFLIPSGTVHCSGANNLVLEISATPYIYTFKIYDYLRSDLKGQLRHVHLERAFANLEASRRATWVRQQLMPEPVMLREGEGWAEYCIGAIDLLFFAIHRLEFTARIDDDTAGTFLALNLVEGDRCEILTAAQQPIELRFAETIVIPATVGRYRIRSIDNQPCKIVKAFVKG